MGGSTSIEQPTPPAPPSPTASLQEYINSLPQLLQAEQQYGLPMAQTQQQINEALYPNTAGLQELFAKQVAEGATQSAPDWYTNQAEEGLKSQLGRNLVYNPRAQESYATGLESANQQWKQYYQNLGLSLAGRQPLTVSQPLTGSYTPAAVLSANTSTYSPYASAYSSMYNTNAQMAQQGNPWANIGGAILGTGLGAVTGGWGNAFGASLVK